jgi:hypothetical protein
MIRLRRQSMTSYAVAPTHERCGSTSAAPSVGHCHRWPVPAGLVEEHAKKLAGPTEEGHGLPSCADLLTTMEGEKRSMLQGGLDHSTRSSKHHQGGSGSMGQGKRYQPKEFSFEGGNPPSFHCNLSFFLQPVLNRSLVVADFFLLNAMIRNTLAYSRKKNCRASELM